MRHDKFSDVFFSSITLFGTAFFYAAVVIYLWIIGSSLAIMLAVTLVIIEFVGAAIKLLYPTERPVPLPRKTFYQKYDAGSFPSIHTARITATMIFIGAENLNFIVAAAGALLSFGVGYSRIYLKKHRIFDVIAGSLMGVLFSSAVLWVMG